MLKIAFVPAVEESMYKEQKLFNWSKTYDLSHYRDDAVVMKFISDWDRLDEVDCFVFTNYYKWQEKWLKDIYSLKLENRLVYHMTEPETVMSHHTKEGSKFILKYYHYILSWNRELIDNKRIFFSLPSSYTFIKYKEKKPFNSKKLFVNISGNKISKSKKELYSERKRVIKYCENHCKKEFDLFGYNWDSESLDCYKGICQNKYETYQQYKFALCFENESTATYITEKILDCFVAGIVPIYLGAPDITDYIPSNCFISYNNFSCISDLIEFLRKMTEEEYERYVVASEKWMNSELSLFFKIDSYIEPIKKVGELCRNTENTFKIKKTDAILRTMKNKMLNY